MSAALLLLKRVPIWVWPVLALVVWGYTGHARTKHLQAEARAVEMKRAEAEAKALSELRAKESAQAKEKQDAIEQNAQAVARARAAADRAATAEQRLRIALDTIRAGAASGAASAPGAATGALADVLGECVSRHRAMAAEADSAREAGLLCERIHDAAVKASGD